jgi:hypothetical protein
MSEERIIVRVAKDQFNVIAGHVLNAEPLTKAEADRLAGHSPVAPVVAAAAPVPDDPSADRRKFALDIRNIENDLRFTHKLTHCFNPKFDR